MYPWLPTSEGPESTVRRSDGVSRDLQFGATHDALGNQIWMFHEAGYGIDDARNQNLILRKLNFLPNLPFMSVARI